MSDLEFVQKCVRADKASWDQFVSKYSLLIYRYIHSVLRANGVTSSYDHAKDLFQEIFVSLRQDNFKKLRSYKGKNGCTLASWLRQVVVNHTISYLRKLQPSVSLDEDLGDGVSPKDFFADPAPLPSQTFLHRENNRDLAECIKRLSLDDKYFVELHFHLNLKPDELAHILRISRGAVDMRKLRIMERLRDCFKTKGYVLDF
jgi:RNA polymerase sigma factor (sigma-70 family)